MVTLFMIVVILACLPLALSVLCALVFNRVTLILAGIALVVICRVMYVGW